MSVLLEVVVVGGFNPFLSVTTSCVARSLYKYMSGKVVLFLI